MSSWPRHPIGEVCDLVLDCINKTAPTVDGPTRFKMIRTTNVRNGWVDLSVVRHVSADVFAAWTRRGVPQRGDVILTREAPLGEVGMLRSDDSVFLGQRLVMYRTDPAKLDSRFLLYVLLGPELQAQIRGLGSGATVAHMRVPDCERLLVPVPPLDTQRAVADVLASFDDLVENSQRRISILEKMAGAIYREWFVHFRFPGHEGVELVESDLGSIPEGWDVRPIGQVIETVGGGTPSKEKPEYWVDPSINWYTPSDLTKWSAMFASSSGDQINELGLLKSSAKLFPPRTVMMTSRATIGEIAIATIEASTNQGFISCVPNERLSEFHLYFWLQENVDLFHTLAGGATFKELRKSTFRDLPIAVPPVALETQFNEVVGAMCNLIENLLRQNKLLRKARDLLLPRLISGDLDVSELDLDLEPVA